MLILMLCYCAPLSTNLFSVFVAVVLLHVTESVVRKALVIPQDLPDAVCMEGIRATSLEGLMLNPLPKEFWKHTGKKKKGGGGGGKKKKSKK